MQGWRDMAALVEAAFDWWRAAGVDCAFTDEPQDWLAAIRPSAPGKPAAPADAPPAPAPPQIAPDRGAWPGTLDSFAPWWLAEPSLCPDPSAARVPPSGPAQAPLMLLVPMPEQGDGERLLAGPAGRMVEAFLAAAGLARDDVYFASALPARIAAPDWDALSREGLGAVLAHHIALAAPQKLLVLGRSSISTLLGHDSPKNVPISRSLNHDRGSVPVAFGYDPEAMLAQPTLKAGLWSRWLEWTGT